MSKRPLLRWSLAAAVLALAGVGCRSTPPKSEPKDTGKNDTPKTQPEKKQDPTKKDGITAQDEEFKKRMEEYQKGRTLGQQQEIAESDRYYDQALSYFNKGDFEKAQYCARLAVEKNRENLRARELLAKIDALRSGSGDQSGARSLPDERVQEIKTKIEQAQIEIFNHIRNGERYYNAKMYNEAIREFEEAEFKIKHIPYEVKEMRQLEPLVVQQLKRARDAKVREEECARDMKRREADNEAAAHAVAARREMTQKIAYLLELAYMAFDQKKFPQCIKLCNEILTIDAHYTVATELKEDAQKAGHREEYYKFIRKKIDNWKSLTDSDDEAVIPYADTVRFPSAAEWREISKRIKESVIKGQGEGTAQEDEDILAIQSTLEKTKIDMTFDGAKLDDIIAFIRDFTNLNIVVDDSIRAANPDIDGKAISFKVKGLVLKNVLKLLLGQFGLDYTIDPETKVVKISTPDKTGGRAVVELHDVRDILVKIQDFPGPKVELTSPSGGGTPLTGATFTLEEPKASSVGGIDDIITLIKENIGGGPSAWEGEYTIEATPNQQLLVNHTQKVHREIREFLGKLRSYTGTMVAVTARFVAAFDDFLDDVGVDILNQPPGQGGAAVPGRQWPGTPGDPFQGGAAENLANPSSRHLYRQGLDLLTYSIDYPGLGLTDIDDASGIRGPGFIANRHHQLEAYDLRAQTFHTLLKFDPLTGVGLDPLQNRLVNQGGLGLQYQWIGEQALQGVLRALHKQQKATIVQAPRVTVFNTQRSHIMVLTQIAYVRDLDPQIATLAAAYDPVIGTLTQGVVLDVRPIVSNDRKYVTLELRPSLAELQFMRNININTGANVAQQNLATANQPIVQLPWLILQKAETTVTVPDRGTLMISGFKDILMNDMHSGVPFIEHIPVLSFFASRKGKASERRRLMILVTPEIIDLAEHEQERF